VLLRRADIVMASGMTERYLMSKPSRSFAKPLRDIAATVVGPTFRRQGFASAELITRWPDIVGAEIAVHSEPIKIQWPRTPENQEPQPGTLVLRVEGPAAIEVQHLSNVICERVNRFLGWGAVARIALRQAPLRQRSRRAAAAADAAAVTRVAVALADIEDEDLRQALARLGAAIRRS